MEKTREQVRKEYAEGLASVRDRRDLSDDGRRAHMAALLQDSRRAMKAITEGESPDREQQRSQLVKRLFGNPTTRDSSSIVSYRDAQDRANQLTSPSAARAALEQAELVGDEHLARAIAHHAARNADSAPVRGGWDSVLETWAGARPEMNEALEQLGALNDSAGDRNTRFARRVANTLPVPAELQGSSGDLQLSWAREAADG